MASTEMWWSVHEDEWTAVMQMHRSSHSERHKTWKGLQKTTTPYQLAIEGTNPMTSRLSPQMRMQRAKSHEELASIVKGLRKKIKVQAGEMLKIKDIFRTADTNGDKMLSQAEFTRFIKTLGITQTEVVSRMFRVFDEDSNGSISLAEFVHHLAVLLEGSFFEKMEFAFKVYDLDGNGELQLKEVEWIVASMLRVQPSDMREYMSERDRLTPNLCNYTVKETDSDFMAAVKAVMKKFDADGNTSITFEEFFKVVKRDPLVMEMLGRVLPSFTIEEVRQKVVEPERSSKGHEESYIGGIKALAKRPKEPLKKKW